MSLLEKAKKSGPAGGLFSKARLYAADAPKKDTPALSAGIEAPGREKTENSGIDRNDAGYSAHFPEKVCSRISGIDKRSGCWAQVLDILHEETARAPIALYRKDPSDGYCLFAILGGERLSLPETLQGVKLDDKRDGFLDGRDIATLFAMSAEKGPQGPFSGIMLPGTPTSGFILIGIENPPSGRPSARIKTALSFAAEKAFDSLNEWGMQKLRAQDLPQDTAKRHGDKRAFQAVYEIQCRLPGSVRLADAAFSCLHDKMQRILTSKGFVREKDKAHGTMVFFAKEGKIDTELILMQVKKSFRKMTDGCFDLAFRSPKYVVLGDVRSLPRKG